MAHTYANLWTHAVFSTKDRERLLDHELKPRLFSYMAGIIENLKGQPLLINGPSDHVHMLLVLPADLSLSELMKKVKANSSRWVHENWPSRSRFAWQRGYAAFSVSHAKAGETRRYIAKQEEHHRKLTFQEEVTAFLKNHGIQYDPRFVFDQAVCVAPPGLDAETKRTRVPRLAPWANVFRPIRGLNNKPATR